MSLSFDVKRAEVVAKMIFKLYDNDLEESFLYKEGLYLTFKNKPEQVIEANFALFDTWDKIKSKMDKLVKSDGICVVCCEPEIRPLQKVVIKENGKKSYRYKRPSVRMCDSCCEFTCMSCFTSMLENGVGNKGHKCPVCRTCLLEYKHKLDGNKECKWC
jgi:hypothetical protein